MTRVLPALLLALGAACASGPSLRVVLPDEPLPDLFAPATWISTCEQLLAAVPGGARSADGRGFRCTVPLDRLPLGRAELTLRFAAGPERFTAAAVTRWDAPPCEAERPRPPDCGAEPTAELTTAAALLRRAVEQRLGPPLATLMEGGNRSAEWRQAAYTLTVELRAPPPGGRWSVSLVAVPARAPALPR